MLGHKFVGNFMKQKNRNKNQRGTDENFRGGQSAERAVKRIKEYREPDARNQQGTKS